MPRKMVLQMPDGTSATLQETQADEEEQLRRMVKDNPDLLPIEEFGFSGPVMVLGRETTVRSGAVDLVALARSGELLVIEFKTGPQNSDFRSALAQLLDYGADLWRMSLKEFESTVFDRYRASEHCDPQMRTAGSMDAGMRLSWPKAGDEELKGTRDHLAMQLASGSFHYLLVAQRFTENMEHTIEYLNAAMNGSAFYAVELVRFDGESVSAFETRTLKQPTSASRTSPTERIDEVKFVESLDDESYRVAMEDFLEFCHGLALDFYWGSVTVRLGVRLPNRSSPKSIAWLNPPGERGWMALTDVTLGWEHGDPLIPAPVSPLLRSYVDAAAKLEGAELLKSPRNLEGAAVRFSPQAFATNFSNIREIVATLVAEIGELG